jgi:hypothetical protein
MTRSSRVGARVALVVLLLASVAFGAGLVGAFDVENDLGRAVPFFGVFEAY